MRSGLNQPRSLGWGGVGMRHAVLEGASGKACLLCPTISMTAATATEAALKCLPSLHPPSRAVHAPPPCPRREHQTASLKQACPHTTTAALKRQRDKLFSQIVCFIYLPHIRYSVCVCVCVCVYVFVFALLGRGVQRALKTCHSPRQKHFRS